MTSEAAAASASRNMYIAVEKLVKKSKTQKETKKVKKGVAKRVGMWYYTWAPRAAGKNDFWKRQKQSERTNMDTLKNEPQVQKDRKASEKSAWQKITSVVK